MKKKSAPVDIGEEKLKELYDAAEDVLRESKTTAKLPNWPTIESDLSLDLGNGFVNAIGTAIKFDDRAIVGEMDMNANALGMKLPKDSVFYWQGWWVSGKACYRYAPESFQDNVDLNRYLTFWYKLLFVAALNRAFCGQTGKIIKLYLVFSIPAKLYRLQKIADAVFANLMGTYEIQNVDGESIYIEVVPERSKQIPEGLGTYYRYLYGSEPEEAKIYATGEWIVADFGYLSGDKVRVQNGEYLPTESDSDDNVGHHVAVKKLAEHILQETGTSLPFAIVDDMIEKETETVNGTPIKVAELRQTYYRSLSNRASRLLDNWTRNINVKGILLTGGFSPKLKPYLSPARLPIDLIHLARDPRRDNVLGGYLFLQELKKKAKKAERHAQVQP